MFEQKKLHDSMGLILNGKSENIVSNFSFSEYYKSNNSLDSELNKENLSYGLSKKSIILEERSLSCVTPIYPEISKRKGNYTGKYNHDVFLDNPNNFWDSLLILKKKVVGIFWSIVSLDKDEPLYDYSTPIGEVIYFGNRNNDVNKVDVPSLSNGSFLSEPLKVGVVVP
ncbi:hypothetical protein FG386_000756 [Cryptosporidium ryanae]|uniref:uncharacterized protein n=1 Tax=Cryptosporidium ryanae TaxID=515981 RepID=UPI00351A5C09|nr:hypothetical protein FG386_000756 [Cryptosporidium ryanae]